MAREIRAPEQVADELDAWKLVMYATDIARIVAPWLDGYAEGMADAVEPMAEWYRMYVDWGDDG